MEPELSRHAVVVFDSRYGSTARVAEALVRGLRQAPGVDAQVAYAPTTGMDAMERADLVIVGGPTEFFHESRHLREFFSRVAGFDFHDKFGFAFDTHAGRPLSGTAARGIASELDRLGLTMLRPRASAVTVAGAAHPPNGSTTGPFHLAPGAEAQFESIGEELGKSLLLAIEKRRVERLRHPELSRN
jgi:flavorubredoxin